MSESVLSVLLHQAMLLSLSIVLLAIARRPLLRRLGAGAAYAAWLLVPALLLTPLLPRPAQEPLQLVLQAAAGSTAPALPALRAPDAPAPDLWLALWLAGACAVAGLQAWRQWRLERLAGCLPAGCSPALVGLWRPRVALPADFEQRFSTEERELILAHEQVHRDRLDNLWNLLACALTALHWWNPLVWWAARRLQADQELACDAVVLGRQPRALAAYTRALLAAHDLTPHGAPLASRWGTRHPLVERIAMLKHATSPKRRHLLMLGATILSIVGTSYAVQTAKTEPPVVDGFLQLRYEIRLSVDGREIAHPRLVSYPAAPSAIVFTEPDAGRLWQLALSSTFTDDKHLMVDTEVSLNDDETAIRAWNEARGGIKTPALRPVAAPRLLVQDGGVGRIETTTPDGLHRLVLELTVSAFRNPTPDYSTPKW